MLHNQLLMRLVRGNPTQSQSPILLGIVQIVLMEKLAALTAASPSSPRGSKETSRLIVAFKTAASEHCLGICCITNGEDGVLTVLASSSVGSTLSKCTGAQGGVCTLEC